MADIRHRVGIGASPDTTYRALSTTEGLSGWWTRKVEGDPAVGSRLRFLFGDDATEMEVTDLVPGQRVAWRCVGGPDEWVGTDLTFDLSTSGNETVVLFTQAGWREPVPFMHHCSTKWAVFLLGLKAGLEGGAAMPFPDDQAISNWG